MNPATLRAELQSEDLAADRLGEFAAAAVMELGRGLAAPPKRASKEQRAAAARILRSIQATESTWSRLRDLAADPDYAGIGPLRAQAQPELVNTQAALLALDSLDERLLNRIAEVLPELVEASSEDERIVPPMATTTRHAAAPVTLADASEGDGVTSLPLAGLPVFGGGGALGPVGGYQPRMLIGRRGVSRGRGRHHQLRASRWRRSARRQVPGRTMSHAGRHAVIERRAEQAVSDYIAHHQADAAAEMNCYRATPSLRLASRRAARVRTADGGKHPHQWRIPRDALREFGARGSRTP